MTPHLPLETFWHAGRLNTCPEVSVESVSAALSSDPGAALLRRLVRLGWDCPDLRRLCSSGYSPGAVWRLLASVPPSLQAAIRDALAGPADAAQRQDADEVAAALPFTDAGAGRGLGGFGSADGPQGEAERVFREAEDLMQRAMEADTETGYLEVRYDPASQRRTHTYLNERYAALRGASRPALLARLSAHTADLPAPPPDFLAGLLHALLRRRAATCTQHVRAACGGRVLLLWEHSRKVFDGDGRVVKVHAARAAGWSLFSEFQAARF
jgi:hypothetical protein